MSEVHKEVMSDGSRSELSHVSTHGRCVLQWKVHTFCRKSTHSSGNHACVADILSGIFLHRVHFPAQSVCLATGVEGLTSGSADKPDKTLLQSVKEVFNDITLSLLLCQSGALAGLFSLDRQQMKLQQYILGSCLGSREHFELLKESWRQQRALL